MDEALVALRNSTPRPCSWLEAVSEDIRQSSSKKPQPPRPAEEEEEEGRWAEAEAPCISLHLHIVLKLWALGEASWKETCWEGELPGEASGQPARSPFAQSLRRADLA